MRQYCLLLAWLIALSALIITLYSSIILSMPTCNLCWYQRICLYPLVIILGIGAYQNDKRSIVYALPLAMLGALLALYQTVLQWFPSLESIGVCGLGPKCSEIHLHLFGFITYPMLSFIASLVLTMLLSIALNYHNPS